MNREKTIRHLKESEIFEPGFMSQYVPIVWKKAYGTTVEDIDGNKFLDFTSAILVANIGHTHPKLVRGIQEQATELLACYDFPNPYRLKLAKKLVEITPKNLNKAFILTTGTEAVEAAVKMARNYTGKHEIISFQGSFHGRTNFALSLGGKMVHRKGFGPFASSIIRAPYPYLYRCPVEGTEKRKINYYLNQLDWIYNTETSDNVAALIIESYQGAGGIIIPPKDYMRNLEKWCKKKNIIFIIDEVQAGFGRTGKMFAFQHFGIKPNLLCVGKGMTCGVPGSAVIGEARIMDSLRPGSMSSTYAGNALTSRAGYEAITILQKEKIPQNAAKIGKYIINKVKNLQKNVRYLGDVRGLGLSIGLEMVKNKKTKEPYQKIALRVVEECFKRNLLLLNPTGMYGNVILLAPPLIITKKQADHALNILEDILLLSL